MFYYCLGLNTIIFLRKVIFKLIFLANQIQKNNKKLNPFKQKQKNNHFNKQFL